MNFQVINSKVVAVAVLSALLLSLIISLSTHDSRSAVYEGDFVPFYTAAKMLTEPTLAPRIYDLRSLQEQQTRYWPELEGVYAIGYPPYYFVLLIPLTALSPLAAKSAFALFLSLATLGAALFVAHVLPQLQKYKLELAAGFLSFPPLLHSLVGGQNSALSLLALTSLIVLLSRNSKLCDLLGGAVLGIWLFKPHLSLLFLGASLSLRRLWTLPSFLGVALVYYAVSVYFVGPTWIELWLDGLKIFVPGDIDRNSFQMINIAGILSVILGPSEFVRNVSWCISATILAIAYLRLAQNREQSNQLIAELCAFSALAVICAPHALYYDLSLMLPLLALIVSRSSFPLVIIGGTYALSVAGTMLKDSFSISPLLPFSLLGLTAWLYLPKAVGSADEG